jgi:hypothetical protein
MPDLYNYDRASLLTLFMKLQFPEAGQREVSILRDFLTTHINDYDRYSFSVRVGKGAEPDPTHLPGIQANTAYFTKKRIDMLAWQGPQAFIFECKERIDPRALGQILTYAHLWVEEHPDARPPILAAIGRFSDPDTLRVFTAAGVTVYLVGQGDDSPGDAVGGAAVDDTETA